eukprot:252641-Rhodomonas_salina.1
MGRGLIRSGTSMSASVRAMVCSYTRGSTRYGICWYANDEDVLRYAGTRKSSMCYSSLGRVGPVCATIRWYA